MYSEDYGYHRRSFAQAYRCYPVSSIDKPHLENSDKIIMPESALDCLASMDIEYPMLFELHNPLTQRVSHCGVLEFTAEEGMVFMPNWVTQNLLLQVGDIVEVKNASLPACIFVKLQPHTKDFLDVSNPKALLEMALRSYSCLTTGDTIMLAYNNKKYYISVLETKPSSAVSIIETDCEVEFAPPVDYKEPEKAAPSTSSSQQGTAKAEPQSNPFIGVGRRLDGKPITSPLTFASSASKEPQQAGASGMCSSSSSQSSRKLVFGSNASQAPKLKDAEKASANMQPQLDAEQRFRGWSGGLQQVERIISQEEAALGARAANLHELIKGRYEDRRELAELKDQVSALEAKMAALQVRVEAREKEIQALQDMDHEGRTRLHEAKMRAEEIGSASGAQAELEELERELAASVARIRDLGRSI